MPISTTYPGHENSFGIGDFFNGSYSDKGTFDFTYSPDSDTVDTSWNVIATDDTTNAHDTFFNLPFAFAGGQGADSWKFTIDKDFFAAHVGATLLFEVRVFATDTSGQTDGSFTFAVVETLQPFDPGKIQAELQGIERHTEGDTVNRGIAHEIDSSQTTEAAFVNSLLSESANTTIPAVAVEGSMYDHVGTSAEIDNLWHNFLPSQIATAAKFGLNQQVYACEVLGLAFAAGDENGGTGFATNYGPSNPSTPNTPDGDAAFAEAASMKIFGSAANANTPDAIAGFVANWKAFYTSFGIPGILNPTSDQIDLFARGAAWGDAVGVALDGNLGQLPLATINFLKDAAQGIAKYGASLASQPIPALFEGESASASAASQVQLTGIPADAQHFGM